MDIRVLRYFLTIAQEESFSRAAQTLYMSQPTLSRQIRELEEELGATLFLRTNRSVQLTKDGMRLRKRARELVDLMDKTQNEFSAQSEKISGEIGIGGGETHVMRCIARIATQLQQDYPDIRYHLYSGNAGEIADLLDKGLVDFGLFVEPANAYRYDFLRLPGKDTWGVLMPASHPLCRQAAVAPDDLRDVPLIFPRQSLDSPDAGGLRTWLGEGQAHIHIAATYNLLFNAAMLVEQGMGCALCLDHLVREVDSNGLAFRPLSPILGASLALAWKKYSVFSPAAELLLRRLQTAFLPQEDESRFST